MHSYLKAIGFSDITDKKKLDQILKEVIHTYDEKIVVEDGKTPFVCRIGQNVRL